MPEPLDEVLRRAQDLGFLGPRPVADQRQHAERLCQLALAGSQPAEFLDLGSGGGLPGLVLATLTSLPGTLLEAQQRRSRFLADAVDALGLRDRIEVLTARAEDAGRDPAHRERYSLVISRGFGPPAVTAECGVPFLEADGRLVVSEPPDADASRWDPAALLQLGLSAPDLVALGSTHAAVLHRCAPLDPRWPRKTGTPRKRPLW